MIQLDYSKINERTFDFLAERYRKVGDKLINSGPLTRIFSQYISGNFIAPSVLEIGVGSGNMLKYFSELCFRTIAIDISSKMIEVAKIKSLSTDFIHSDFLSYNFLGKRFSGIFADSVLHLFPRDKIEKVFDKVYSLLENRGCLYVSIPLFKRSEEELINRGKKIMAF